MQKPYRMCIAGLLTACSLPCMAIASKAAPAPVAINLHTQLYDINGEDGNVFTVYMGTTEKTLAYVDAGYGMVEYDVAPAVYNSETQSIDASMMTFRVSEAGNVTIYCDPELIDYLDLEGMYITQIDMEDLTNLEILNMDHNQLESLDLTPFSALQSISLSDNPFNVTPLVVGANKPDLTILTLDMIDNMSDSFNISDYPALMVFSAWNNRSLHSLDLSGCPSLVRLSIDGTDVSSLDLTKVPNLRILNITDTRISNIDLSVVPDLREFYAQHQSGTINTGIKLSSIDVSHNPELRYLYLAGNDLTDIDLSNNPLLQMLNVSHNRLTSINLDENPDLIMYTEPITIKLSGIDATLSHDDLRITSANGSITVTAPKAITASLYSIDGKLAGKATGNDGTVVFDNLVNGVYILVTPAGAYRVLVK